MVLADGITGQTMEPVVLRDYPPPADLPAKDWALGCCRGREKNLIYSLDLDPEKLEPRNQLLLAKWKRIEDREVRWIGRGRDDAELAVVAYGTSARVALTAVRWARARRVAAGLFRPISLAPFPERELADLSSRVGRLLVVEMNEGQMLEDVRRVAAGRAEVRFYGRLGGMVPTPEELLAQMEWTEDRVT
jgi:2-oxoglutarate/2-oxoacid ferredoxin oxidoreductase subunit alpha